MGSTFLRDNDSTWTRYLNHGHHDVELGALKDETVLELSSYLDMRIYSLDDGRYSDYTGLADAIRLNFGFVESLRYEQLQTFKVVREWQRGQSAREIPSIGNLVRALIRMTRGDVVSACISNIARDAEEYLINHYESRVSETWASSRPRTAVLTMDDLPGRPTMYDAFVIYNEECEHSEAFVTDLVEKLENSPFHLRIYFSKRNGLFGVMKLDNFARVLEERCKNVIVVLSPEYKNCEICSFLTSMSVLLSTRDRGRRIIPVLIDGYQENQIPDVLRMQRAWNLPGMQDPLQWRRVALSVCRFINGEDNNVN